METFKLYRSPIIWSLVIFGIDGLFMGAIAFSAWSILINSIFRFPINLIFSLSGNQKRLHSLKRCSILIVGSLITIAYCLMLDHIAVGRATLVSTAIEQFNEKNGHYPATLQELVPQYVAEIPVLKPILGTANLKYSLNDGVPFLYFGASPVAIPVPKTYSFKTRTWAMRD